MTKACLKCGAPLTQPDTGRPKLYCSVGCRRSAEYEIKRIQRRLENMEMTLRNVRADRMGLRDGAGRTSAQCVADLTGWIEADETRLRELLVAMA